VNCALSAKQDKNVLNTLARVTHTPARVEWVRGRLFVRKSDLSRARGIVAPTRRRESWAIGGRPHGQKKAGRRAVVGPIWQAQEQAANGSAEQARHRA